MELLSKVGRYEFLAEPFHCDFSGHLFMGQLGNHMLNAADFHSAERGYGMSHLNLERKTWVLSRLAIEMWEMPKVYDRFYVDTWVDGAMRYFTSRNFSVVGLDGKTYGYGKSIWAMIDTDTRQPVDILSIQDGLIKAYVDTETPCPIDKSSRVRFSSDAEAVRTIDIYYHDIDVNGHVNSVKYIEHALDLFGVDYYREHRILRFEVAYVAETHMGDRLRIYHEQIPGEETHVIKMTKLCPGNEEEEEIVRSKVKFV